jgi:general secretion pathway protein N
MIRGGAILGLAAGLVAFGDARISAMSATDPAVVNPTESTISRGVVNAELDSFGSASPVGRERPLEPPLLRGNPLWAVPLRSLSTTRERPIFSSSRRPPPPAVAAVPYVPPPAPPPPKPEEPDHPLLALVGTVIGETESIGVFFDQSAQSLIRLRAGEGYAGWVLRSVQGREATFEKGRRAATLALPASGAEPGAPASVAASGGARAGTWMDGDGQIISHPPAMTSQAAPRRAGPDGL